LTFFYFKKQRRCYENCNENGIKVKQNDDGPKHDEYARHERWDVHEQHHGYDDDPPLYVQNGKMQRRHEDFLYGQRRYGRLHDAEFMHDVKRWNGWFSNDDEWHDHDDL